MSQQSDTQTIEHLLEIMHEHDLDRMKVTVGDAVYELVRREAGANVVYAGPAAHAVAAAPASAGAASAVTESGGGSGAPPNAKRITAPLTGVFYRSSSPNAEPFISVGSRVESGEVVCILEAMKLFNEIQSDYAGTVLRILPENGELVSQGEDLIWIAP